MELYTGPFPEILWCWSVGPGITIPLSIRRPLMRFFSRGFQHQGPLVVWSARSYLAAFYLPRLTDGSSSQDGDKRHIYSCLLATRAMNIQGCFSSSLRRKPAGQAVDRLITYRNVDKRKSVARRRQKWEIQVLRHTCVMMSHTAIITTTVIGPDVST